MHDAAPIHSQACHGRVTKASDTFSLGQWLFLRCGALGAPMMTIARAKLEPAGWAL